MVKDLYRKWGQILRDKYRGLLRLNPPKDPDELDVPPPGYND